MKSHTHNLFNRHVLLGFLCFIVFSAQRHLATQDRRSPTGSTRVDKQYQNARRRIIQEWKTVKKNGMALELKKSSRKSKDPIEKLGKESDGDTEAKAAKQEILVAPLPQNMFVWHFTFHGSKGSPFEGGLYHGQVLLPPSYPNAPPRVQMLTPSGRFQPGHDICLSASAYHPETWQPTWTVPGLVAALQAHMLTDAREIGGVHATPEARRRLARESRRYRCRHCGTDHHAIYLDYHGIQKPSQSSLSDSEMESPPKYYYRGSSAADSLMKQRSTTSSAFRLLHTLARLTIFSQLFWIIVAGYLLHKIIQEQFFVT